MKAIALLSGGLDSTLAARLIKDQGIELIALNFKTPFCLCDRPGLSGCTNHSRRVAEEMGIEYKTINITEEFLKIIPRPKHGYGSNMNPCIDCRILKFRRAKEFMHESKASFIITGEVVGQRPMSQHKRTLNLIDKESGLEGLVLRPLSAKILPETLPEKEGWVDRNKLLDINGRSRRTQMDLAQSLNIRDYPCPAGGCLLTDPEFSKKLKNLLKYSELNLDNIELLKAGRYFRISPEVVLVVGRDERENSRIENLAQKGDYLFMPIDIAGPTALGRGKFNKGLIRLGCEVTAFYSDVSAGIEADILYKSLPEEDKIMKVFPLREELIFNFRV